MDARDTVHAFRRRWYLVLVVVAAAVGLATLTATRVGPTYRATASVLLVPPDSTQGTKPVGGSTATSAICRFGSLLPIDLATSSSAACRRASTC